MRKLLGALGALFVTLGIGIPAIGLVGPEPGSPDFRLVFKELEGGPFYDQMDFDTAPASTGVRWDFRQREAYRCASVELFTADDTELLAIVEFEQSFSYDLENPPGFQINDKDGSQHGEDDPSFATDPCGTDEGGGTARNRWVPSGEDHFPHYDHHTSAAPITFYMDGVPVQTLDLVRDQCERGYWTPGDEPGEVVLWWDEDFPENNGHHSLDCGGGGQEPVAAARGFVLLQSPRAGFCIADSLDGDVCGGMTSPPTPTPTPTPTATPTCGKRGCDFSPPPKG